MKHSIIYLLFVMSFVIAMFIPSCTHDPILGGKDDMVMDTLNTDTMMTDTTVTDSTGSDTTAHLVCDPDSVYFVNTILPILVSNCALSGCHNANSASDGVQLDNYMNIIITGDVEPFDPFDSDLYEVLIEDDPDKLMPPTGKLDDETINLIEKWISQGAKNNQCEEHDGSACDTQNISLSNDIFPIIEMKCGGCHSTGVSSGGVTLDNYEGISIVATNGRLIGAITHAEGFSPMPQGLDPLDECTISRIKSWVDEGALDN